MSADTDRDFRGFRSYSDSAPLPIGDPTSGVHDISKAAMRAAFNGVSDAEARIAVMESYVSGLLLDAINSTEVPIFSTVAAVESYTVPTGMNVIYVTGRAAAGTGGTYFKRVASSTKPGAFQDADDEWFEPTLTPAHSSIISGSSSIVVGVGTTGDFADLPAALAAMNPYSASNGRIELRIVSALTKGLLVNDMDAGKFVITSDMGTVTLDAGFEGVSDVSIAGISIPANSKTQNLISGYNAVMPSLGCVIDMGGRGDSGYYGIWNSTGFIYPGCGVINAGYNNLEWRNGRVTAHGAVLTGAKESGIRAAYCAAVAAQGANANDCCSAVDDAETAGAVDVSRTSVVHFRSGTALRSGAVGLNVRRTSTCTFEEADFSNAASYGILWQGGGVGSGFGVTVNNTGSAAQGYGIWVREGSIHIKGGTVKNSAGALDIRIGDSSPFTSSASLDMSNVETTAGTNKTDNINVDNFNTPTRYGTAWNAAVAGPMQEMGRFSATGITRGWSFTDAGLYSSVPTTQVSPHVNFYNRNGYVGGIRTTGSQTSYDTSSDERLKINRRRLGDEVDAGAILDAIEMWAFDWLSVATMEPTGERGHGAMAQALFAIYPAAVSVGRGNPGDEGFVPWSVDYSKLIPLLVESNCSMRGQIRYILSRL